jgi:hypothetical protein
MPQLLIYERAVPVNPRRHNGVSVKSGNDYGFAKNVNSVPLMAVEFDRACTEYPIVFAGEGAGIMPVALLGVRDNENLYVDEKGAWDAKYVPAFVRRYPFVFSSADGKNFTLCIDEEFQGVNRNGVGERLFDAEGERTIYLQRVLSFLQAYQAQFEATRAFTQRLVDLDLLEAMQAQFMVPPGQRIMLGGFMTVNRNRLRALPGEALARLAVRGDLDLIYMHLHSQRNFTPTGERMTRVFDPAQSAAIPAADAELAPDQFGAGSKAEDGDGVTANELADA